VTFASVSPHLSFVPLFSKASPAPAVGDDARAAVHQAMIDHGCRSGIDCGGDVMCAEVFGEFQESVGLPDAGGLDRATWLALGLPLPLDPDAPVELLRAGTLITGC
jgi:hypothetical protein